MSRGALDLLERALQLCRRHAELVARAQRSRLDELGHLLTTKLRARLASPDARDSVLEPAVLAGLAGVLASAAPEGDVGRALAVRLLAEVVRPSSAEVARASS